MGGFGEEMRSELGVTWGGGVLQAYLLIAHLSIGLVSKAQHLPHHNPKAPHIAGGGEGAMGDGFRGCPTDGDLSSLMGHVGQKGDMFQGMVGPVGEKITVKGMSNYYVHKSMCPYSCT